ncbi:MAG: efflux RND transporter periplasmic adaptor subunit [Gammaproteobacteria bacterium]
MSTRGSARSVQPRLGALLALVAAMASAAAADLPFATARVVFEAAARERLWDGRVEAINQATVSAQTAGRVAEILYDIGDYVPAGAVIVRFTDVEQRASQQQVEANLKEAEAALTQARKDFERVNELYDRKLLPRSELDQAIARRDAASARLEAARSALTGARQQVDYTVVRAPYAGIVTARQVQIGETVSPGQPLMTGLSLDDLRVSVDLPQGVIEAVRRIRQAAVLTPDAAARVAVVKITIFPYADSASNTFRVRLDLPSGTQGLYPGMLVKAAFVIGDARRLLIPASAVVYRSEVSGVYVVGGDSDVRFRQVRVGNRFGERVEILAGLQEGETVAVDPVRAAQYLKESDADGR